MNAPFCPVNVAINADQQRYVIADRCEQLIQARTIEMLADEFNPNTDSNMAEAAFEIDWSGLGRLKSAGELRDLGAELARRINIYWRNRARKAAEDEVYGDLSRRCFCDEDCE